jgi:hypothetical protein
VASGSVITPKLIGSAVADTKNEDEYIFDDDSWKAESKNEQDEYYSFSENERYIIGNGLRSFGGQWALDGNWEVLLDLDGYGAVRRYPYDQTPEDGYGVDRIGRHRVSLLDADDGSTNTSIFTSADSKNLSGWPAEEYDTFDAAEDVFVEIAKVAVAQVDQVVDGVLTAKQVYDKVYHEWSSKQESENESYEYRWEYADGYLSSDAHSDVDHYLKWEFHMGADDHAHHYAESYMATGGYGIQLAINWKVHVYSPSSSPSSMTASEREQYGVRKVPAAKAAKAGFNVKPENLVDGDQIWYASNIPVEAEIISVEESPIPRPTE